MNRVRIRSVATAAVAAIFAAGIALADPGEPAEAGASVPESATPPGWIPLPRLLDPSSQAPASVFALQASGDPASGCFLLSSVGTLSGSFDRKAYDRGLERSLARAGVKVAMTADGQDASFASKELQGTIHTTLSSSSDGQSVVETRACFYNQRQPSECERLCAAAIEGPEASR